MVCTTEAGETLVPQDEQTVATAPPNGRAASTATRIASAFLLGAAMWLLVWLSSGPSTSWLRALFIAASIILVVGLFVLRTELRWAKPTRALCDLIERIHTGQAPIEELERIDGGAGRLVAQIATILRDLRRQKLEVAKLNEEIRQRVATRTFALERQIGSLQQQASRDPLTGLHNRRLFEACLSRMLDHCTRERIDLSLMMIDVDNFKLLNDTLGHPAGDDLLRDIGQIIRSGIREQDAAFRLGGDEFVIILPGCPAPPAQSLARRLSDLVDGLAKTLRLSRSPRLSIGIVSISEIKSPTHESVIAEADRRLYEVKASRKSARLGPITSPAIARRA